MCVNEIVSNKSGVCVEQKYFCIKSNSVGSGFSCFLFVLYLLVCRLASNGHCQNPTEVRPIIVVGVGGKSIPDPSQLLFNVAYLSDPKVAADLGLSESELTEISVLLKETRGQPNIVVFEPKPGEKELTEAGYELQATLIKSARLDLIERTLDPNQVGRLKQIAYRTEIARGGIEGALLRGYLGEEIGIEETEKNRLATIIDAITKKLNISKASVIKRSFDQIMELLPSTARDRLPEVIGPPFEVIESVAEKVKRKFREQGFLKKTINPESIVEVVSLLENTDVATRLEISSVQRKSCIRLLSVDTRKAESKEGVERRILEVLPSRIIARLKQIAYRFEIHRFGIGLAISDKFLGEAIGLSEQDRRSIRDACIRISNEAKADLMRLEEAAAIDIIGNLPAAQQTIFLRLIGKPVVFDD
jgi:hypothetical protein